MPETNTGKRQGLSLLQRFGVHLGLLVGAGIAVYVGVLAGDDGTPQISPDAAGLGDLTPPPEMVSDTLQPSYVRSPLLPDSPEAETASGTGSQPQLARPQTDERSAVAVEDLAPLFLTHTVVEGDTVSQLAEEFGVTQQTILDNNQEIVDPAALEIGQQITVPTVDGILHTVQLGQDLETISQTFEAESAEILNFAGNGLRSAEDLQEGEVVLVVGGTFPDPVEFQPIPGDGFPLVVPESGFLAGFPPAVNPDTKFILPYWPCAAPSAIQDFGYARGRLHAGVDMPSFCARSSNVYAAQTGTVVLADWNGGYGQLIVIDHGFGFESYYAHLSQIQVTRGQYVYRGQVIGVSGNTGASYGEHLHFEIRINGQPTDPKPYLPWPF